MLSRGYSINGLNQYVAAGGVSFGYDANGNLTADGTVSYAYDIENRLTNASGAKTANLSYDPLGRLYATSGGADGVTRFLYDGDELVAEYDGAGALRRRYVHGAGDDDPLVWYEAGVPSWLHSDHQGSIVARSDASGQVTGIATYDEWGIPGSANWGPDNKSRFQYTGQAWIPELGMYYYKARIYSPTIARFLQVDPIGYDDRVNLYAYVANDPVNNIDPSGMSCEGNSDGRGVTCRIDNPGELKGKDLDRANKAYTRAVNRLLVDPSRQVSLQATDGDGKNVTATTTAGEIANGLINAEVSYQQSDGGNRWNAATSRDGGSITLFGNGVRQDDTGLARTIIHEGAHTTRANDQLRTAYENRDGIIGRFSRSMGYSDNRHFNPAHQRSFKEAARNLFSIKVP